jgi:competence protein ComEC
MPNQDVIAICHFLNVGQGTSQVIELGQQKVIVIDTGSQSVKHSPLFTLLAERDIKSIEALILSHNDTDHINGIASLLQKYAQRIKRIDFLIDRKDNSNIIQTIKRYYPLEFVHRLEVDTPNLDKDIFKDSSVSVCVKVLFPTFSANIQYQRNETCAIVMLIVGTQKVIFSSDAPIAAWRDVVKRNENKQMKVNILTVPHHGGSFVDQNEDECWQWFFENIRTNYAIVSAGYNNTYGHPTEDVIHSFIRHGVEIFCTQSNPICCGGTSNDTTCCGTIIVNIGKSTIDIENIEQLRQRKKYFSQRMCNLVPSLVSCVYEENIR